MGIWLFSMVSIWNRLWEVWLKDYILQFLGVLLLVRPGR